MRARCSSARAVVALLALFVLARLVAASGVVDEARVGAGVGPVAVTLAHDGTRLALAAFDSREVITLDLERRATGPRVTFDAHPLGVVTVDDARADGADSVLVFFHQRAQVCELELKAAGDEPSRRPDPACFTAAGPDDSPQGGGLLRRARWHLEKRPLDATHVVLDVVDRPGPGLFLVEARWDTVVEAVRVVELGRRADGRWEPRARSAWYRYDDAERSYYTGRWPAAWVAGPGPRLVLAKPGTGQLLAFDDALRVNAERQVGWYPKDLAVDAGGGAVLVTDPRLGVVMELDAATLALRSRRRVGAGPASILLDPRGALCYVADPYGREVLAVGVNDLAVERRRDIDGRPVALALDAARHRLHVALLEPGGVVTLDADSFAVEAAWP